MGLPPTELSLVTSRFLRGFLMVNGDRVRSERNKAIIRVRAKVLEAARSWFSRHDFVEVQGPVLVPAFGDRPGSFLVNYFDKKAYLCQGLQPYSEAFVEMFGKIYTIAPSFRAEKLRTARHLTEFWRIETAASCDLNEIMGVQERLVTSICHKVAKDAVEELKLLGRPAADMAMVRSPFARITYDEAVELLQEDGNSIHWGNELGWEMESKLSPWFEQPFFVTEFPVGVQTFFYKTHPQKSELTLSADLLAPKGYGEIGSGGQMINEKEVLLEKMKEEKVEPADQQWYMSFIHHDSASHSGFAVGFERLLQWICRFENIREAAAFPRVYDSIYP
jgi:asparaginyl-tRNA synthetase